MSAQTRGFAARDLLNVAKWWGWSVVAVAWVRRRPVATTSVPPLEAGWGVRGAD